MLSKNYQGISQGTFNVIVGKVLISNAYTAFDSVKFVLQIGPTLETHHILFTDYISKATTAETQFVPHSNASQL